MAWIRVEENYSRHPKIRRFARLMGNPLAEAYVVRLWTWASECQPNGDLSGMPDDEIADAVGFAGRPEKLVSSLLAAGLLDADRAIHDWHDYQRSVVGKREADKARAKQYREVRSLESQDRRKTTERPSPDSRETVARHSTTQHDTAQHDTREEPSSPSGDMPRQPSLLSDTTTTVGKRARDAEIDRVLAHWKRVHGSDRAAIDGKAGEKRRKRVKARLDEGTTADECILAIDGALKDDWLMGRDPKSPREYRDVETLLRDRAQVERLGRLALGEVLPRAHGAPENAPAASRGASNAISGGGSVREWREYDRPPPEPGPDWTPEAALAKLIHRPAFMAHEPPGRFVVPKGKSLGDFDTSRIPPQHLPILDLNVEGS